MAKVARGDVHSIILPDEVSETLLRGVGERSLIRRLARGRTMTTNRVKLTEAEVTGANVFWVGEGQRKQTDKPTTAQATWTFQAAELAVIIPVDENVYEDANVDLFDLYRPAIETAVARKLDGAALFGVDVPSDWGSGISINEQATTVGHVFEEDGTPTDTELLNLISGTGASPADGALQAIEDDGYEPNAFVSATRFKARLRGLKDADGRHIFGDATVAGVPSTLFGIPISFVGRDQGAAIWDNDLAHMIVGDWSQAMVGVRQELRYKSFDQGVITDGSGNVVYSLMENDMIALRVTGRFAFKVFAPETADGESLSSGSEYPFAVVAPAIP